LYITHNLGVVARICDRVGVMYAGEMLEEGSIQRVFKHKLHPYTLGLLGCVPRIDMDKRDISLHTIPGHIPRPDALRMVVFSDHACTFSDNTCHQTRHSLMEVEPEHFTVAGAGQMSKKVFARIMPRKKAKKAIDQKDAPLVLDARNIEKQFKLRRSGLSNLFSWKPEVVRAVDNISIRVRKGATMGIVAKAAAARPLLRVASPGSRRQPAAIFSWEAKPCLPHRTTLEINP